MTFTPSQSRGADLASPSSSGRGENPIAGNAGEE
jgi:hypothetical protein